MRRVANGKIARDREGGDIGRELGQCSFQGGGIEGRFIAVDIMAAGNEKNRIVAERIGQTVALQVFGPEADHDQAGAPTLPFHKGVCRKCRRE